MAAPKFTPSTRPTVVSTAPAGLSENLTRDAKPVDVIDFSARIDSELAALNQAVDGYNNDHGKTEQALVDAKRDVSRIMAELNAAQQRLKDLENAGSSLDKYNAALEKAEGQFTKIAGLYVEQVQSKIIHGWFQRDVDVSSISNERKNDLKLHKRIVDLQGFKYVPPTNIERYLSDGRIVVRDLSNYQFFKNPFQGGQIKIWRIFPRENSREKRKKAEMGSKIAWSNRLEKG